MEAKYSPIVSLCRPLLRAHPLTCTKFNVVARGREVTVPHLKLALYGPPTETLKI